MRNDNEGGELHLSVRGSGTNRNASVMGRNVNSRNFERKIDGVAVAQTCRNCRLVSADSDGLLTTYHLVLILAQLFEQVFSLMGCATPAALCSISTEYQPAYPAIMQ